MNFATIQQEDKQYVMQSYGRLEIALVKGNNATAFDADGKEYIDFTSGIGVNSLGYSDPEWLDAVTLQGKQIQHISNYYYHPQNGRLAKKLAQLSGLQRTFFCNSGAEANECAIKIARQYGRKKGAYQIVSLKQSFHGRTLATLAATGQDALHQDFLPLTDGFLYANPNLESVKSALRQQVCAVMIELIQGEGGVNELEQSFVKQLWELCKKQDVLFMVDEVQTGVARTGSFFAFEQYGVQPDVVTLAKGLGGGLPIGACLVSEKLKDVLMPGMHGSTFGGNPMVCAGAWEVVNRVSTPEFLAQVQMTAQEMKNALSNLPQIKGIYGKGLMIGVDIPSIDAKELLVRCAENGLLILTAKQRIRFLPPLTITKDEWQKGIEIFAQTLQSFTK